MTLEDKQEPTVEQCLSELREMFPDRMTLIQRNDTIAFAGPKLNHWVMIFRYEGFQQRRLGEGSTLSEAMAQVRKFHKEQQR